MWCGRLAEGLLLLLPLAPFLVIPTPSPSEFGGAVAVRALAVVALPLAALAWAGAGVVLRHPVFRWTGMWLVVALAAGLLSPDPGRALLGEHLRAEGWIQYLAWAALSFAGALTFSDTTRWRRFAAWSVAVALAGGTVAVATEVLAWLVSPDGAFNYRPYGWYMNPLFFGNAMALQAGVAFSLVPGAGRRRWLYAVAGSGLGLLALVSGSRSVLMGIAVAVPVALVALRAAGGARLHVRRSALVAAAAAALLLILVLAAPGSFLRLAHFTTGDASVAGRFLVWRADVAFIRERPLLGWGLEHQLPLFYRFFTADFLPVTREVFDRAHNALVESALTTGILGTAAAIGLFAALGRTVLGRMRREQGFRAEGAAFLGMLAHVAVADQFGFLTPLTLVALVPLSGRIVGGEISRRSAARVRWPAATAVVGLALFVVTTLLPARAAVLAARGVARYPADLPAAAADFADATRIPTLFDGQIAKRYGDLIRAEVLHRQVRDVPALLALGSAVRTVLVRAEEAHPWDFTVPMARGALAERLGTLDPTLLAEATIALEETVAAHPERFEPRQLLALSYLREGRDAEALRQYDEMLRRAPDDARLHMMYAIVLYRVGEVPAAFAALNRAEALLPYDLGPQIAGIRARMEAGEAVDPSAGVSGGSLTATGALEVHGQGVVEP